MAKGLHDRGREVLLVERESRVRPRFRGEYLQPSALRVLSSLGFGEALAGLGHRVTELDFHDIQDELGSVNAQTTIRYPDGAAALGLPYVELMSALRSTVRNALGPSFEGGTQVRPCGPRGAAWSRDPAVELTDASGARRLLRPRYVVACDGRNSPLRRWLEGPACPPNGAVTLGARSELIVGAELRSRRAQADRVQVLRSAHDGTLWLFGLGGDRHRLYWNAAAGPARRRSELRQRLEALIERFGPQLGCGATLMAGPSAAPANAAWLGPAHRGRVLLAGDALAVSTPLGGQGMSCAAEHVRTVLGLLDSRSATPLSNAALRTYGRRSLARFKEVSLLNLGIYYLFFSPAPVKRPTRHILQVWNRNPEMLDRLASLFGGLHSEPLRLSELVALWGLKDLAGALLPGRRASGRRAA
jgi:2-polyprenyl-6-methoxyphenol hydroxylase-like FAD-dependent oxidoreductase